MKSLIYEGPKHMLLRDVEIPVPRADEVLIRVQYTGICGSELSGYLGQNSLRVPPVTFGHEFSGTIVEQGKDASGCNVGDRVTANPLLTCGRCRNCQTGRQQLCGHRRLVGAALPGSNAEFVVVPSRFVHRLPDHVSFEQGALTEPVACAVRSVELAGVLPTDSAFVMGMGPIGQLILQLLGLHGVHTIIVADTNAYRLQQAQRVGAIPVNPNDEELLPALTRLTSGRGVDVAFDAVGRNKTRMDCVAGVALGGRVVFVGLHEPETTLDINHVIRNEINLMGSFAYSSQNFESALQLLDEGRCGFLEGIEKAPLADGPLWFERLLGSAANVTKVLLEPNA